MTTDAKNHYLYKLIPPRPDFAGTCTADEAAIMAEHISYWTEQLNRGVAVAFGPVADPSGDYGLGIIEAAATDLAALSGNDPAIRSGLCRHEIYPMQATVRPWAAPNHQ